MDRDLVPVGNFNAAPQPVDDNVDVARGQLTGAPDVLVNEPEKIKKVEIRGKLKPTGSPYRGESIYIRIAIYTVLCFSDSYFRLAIYTYRYIYCFAPQARKFWDLAVFY